VTRVLRMAALIGAGSYAVHQLRYALTPASGAPVEAHAYLAPVGTVVVGLLLFALAAGLARIAGGCVDEAPDVRRLWAGTSASLMAVYFVQESIERLIAHGESPFSDGGWIALPLALAVGLVIALVTRGAAAASEVAAAARRAPAIALGESALDTLLAVGPAPAVRVVARHQAARGPPLASV
jgi:hypothetical protein